MMIFNKLKTLIGWWLFLPLVFLVVAIFFTLRLYHLDLLPIFADEAIYIHWAQVMRAESTLRFLPLSDGKPPLFMWTMIPFFKIISDPLVAGRLVSVFSGLGTMSGVGFLTWLLFKSKKQTLLAILTYSLLPFVVFFDRMALVDSMLSMFGVWTLIFGLLMAKTTRFDFAMLTGFALGGAWLTKSPALFFTILLPTTWLFADWSEGVKKNLFLLFRLALLTFIVFGISQVMYNILRLGPNFQLLSSRNFDYVFPISNLWERPLDPLVPHFKDIADWLTRMGTKPFVFLVLVGLAVGIKKKVKATALLLVWVLFPLLVQSEFAKVFTARYVLFTLPPMIVLSTTWLWARSFWVKFGAVVLTFLMFVLAGRENYWYLTNPQKANLPRSERSGYLEEWTSGYGIKETADWLKALVADPVFTTDPAFAGQVIVGTEGYFGTLPDGLQIYLNNIPQIVVVGVEVKFVDIPKKLIEAKKAGNKVYLLANNTRIKLKNPEDYGLKLIKAYPKGLREFDTREYYLQGPQESLMFYELTNVVK